MTQASETQKSTPSTSHTAIAPHAVEHSLDFDQWAKAVREQMLASLRRRGSTN